MKSYTYNNIKIITIIVLASVCAALLLPSKSYANNDSIIPIEMGRTKIIRLNMDISSIFIGNPAIVDGIVHMESMLVLTGKSFGRTNMIILDKEGNSVFQSDLVVEPDNRERLTIYRGVSEASYHCSPVCTQIISPSDAPEESGKITNSIQNFNRAIEDAVRAAEQASNKN